MGDGITGHPVQVADFLEQPLEARGREACDGVTMRHHLGLPLPV